MAPYLCQVSTSKKNTYVHFIIFLMYNFKRSKTLEYCFLGLLSIRILFNDIPFSPIAQWLLRTVYKILFATIFWRLTSAKLFRNQYILRNLPYYMDNNKRFEAWFARRYASAILMLLILAKFTHRYI